MTTAEALNEEFGLPGALRFEQHGDLVRGLVTLASCEAEFYLQGAHLARWQPAGFSGVLFLSEESAFVPGKAIRGGIPICFPWFGPRTFGAEEYPKSPSHGFARTAEWTLAFAALLPAAEASGGDRLSLTLTLGPDETSRALGYESFRVACEMTLGRELTVRLTVANPGSEPLRFEEALHSYFAVADVRETAVAGLEGAEYLDKRDEGRAKRAPEGPLVLDRFTDRVFPAHAGAATIADRGNERDVFAEKENSGTTVVWNPWTEGAAALKDLGDEEWTGFVAVEAANTGAQAITLAAGAAHTMGVRVTVRPEAAHV